MAIPLLSIRYKEIILRGVPAPIDAQTEARSRSSRAPGKHTQSYDVLVYTQLPLKLYGSSAPEGTRYPKAVEDMPLVGVERIVIRWSDYREYLDAFLEGEQTPSAMRSRLFEVLSPGLEYLLLNSLDLAQYGPIRIWWSSETPELDDLPWELLAYAQTQPMLGRFSFVRGIPGEPAPLVPVDRLRLAVVGSSGQYDPIPDTLQKLPPMLEVVSMPGSPREALRNAARLGYELVHVVADGLDLMTHEGILRFDAPEGPVELYPHEISAMLRGSRITLLSLSPQSYQGSEQRGLEVVPSVYRTFTSLASSHKPLPTILAQLGPVEEQRISSFWLDFYQALVTALSIEEALQRAQSGAPVIPMALFLRHRLGKEFQVGSASRSPSPPNPTQLAADLQVSRSLLDQLQAVDSHYSDLAGNLTQTPLVERESARQAELEQELTPWIDLEGGSNEP